MHTFARFRNFVRFCAGPNGAQKRTHFPKGGSVHFRAFSCLPFGWDSIGFVRRAKVANCDKMLSEIGNCKND